MLDPADLRSDGENETEDETQHYNICLPPVDLYLFPAISLDTPIQEIDCFNSLSNICILSPKDNSPFSDCNISKKFLWCWQNSSYCKIIRHLN